MMKLRKAEDKQPLINAEEYQLNTKPSKIIKLNQTLSKIQYYTISMPR